MTLRYGDEKSLMNRVTAAQLAGGMLMRGTAKHTRQQIQDELDRLKARANVFGGATQAAVTIETTRENLPAVMRLVAEILREPAFPASEFELLKQEQLANIEQNKSEPTQIAFTAFGRTLSPFPKGDVRYITTSGRGRGKCERGNARSGETVLSGLLRRLERNVSLSLATLITPRSASLRAELFGNWKSPKPFARVPSVYKDVAAVNQSFPTPDKANAFFVAGLNLKIRDDNPDYPALLLGNYMLGGGFLNSRLAARIRQKEGLSYGVGSGINISAFDEFGRFTANAIYAPQNVEKLEVAFKEEIARMLKGWLHSRGGSGCQIRATCSRGRSAAHRTTSWPAV